MTGIREQHTPNGHHHFIIPFDATKYIMNRIHHILFVALCSLLFARLSFHFFSIFPLVHYTGCTVELVRIRECLAWVFRTWFLAIIASLRQWCRLPRRLPFPRSLRHLLRDARFHFENQIQMSADAHSSFMCVAASYHPPHQRGEEKWKKKSEWDKQWQWQSYTNKKAHTWARGSIRYLKWQKSRGQYAIFR